MSVYQKRIYIHGNINITKSGVNMQKCLRGKMFHYLYRRMRMNGVICQKCI